MIKKKLKALYNLFGIKKQHMTQNMKWKIIDNFNVRGSCEESE